MEYTVIRAFGSLLQALRRTPVKLQWAYNRMTSRKLLLRDRVELALGVARRRGVRGSVPPGLAPCIDVTL